MACITKTVTVDVETDVDVELDEGEIRELISDEGLGVADLFSDAEIQEAAENTANWEGWLEKSIEEMGDFADAALAAHGYHKSSPAKTLSERLAAMSSGDIAIALIASGHLPQRLAFAFLEALDGETRAKIIARYPADETAIREKVKAEMIAKLFG
jgi:hypothetical protein